MDLLKVLSRSTTLSKRTRQTHAQRPTPSDGQIVNPQLFRDEGEPSLMFQAGRSINNDLGKRKRDKVNDGLDGSLPPELNYFDRAPSKRSEHRSSISFDSGALEGVKTPNEQQIGVSRNGDAEAEAEAEDDLDLRKRILRSHRIKITILSQPTLNNAAQPTNANGVAENKHQKTDPNFEPLRYPPPLTSFELLRSRYGINNKMMRNIAAQGYDIPTEVQLGALPLLCENDSKDNSARSTPLHLLTVAPTGSGKTIAFLIPIFDALEKRKRTQSGSIQPSPCMSRDRNSFMALILAPTKELAGQIVNEGRKLAIGTGLKISLMKKGMSLNSLRTQAEDVVQEHGDQEAVAEDDSNSDSGMRSTTSASVVKSDVIVSTPLAIWNAVRHGGSKDPLARPLFLVLDEADILLDPLFRDQTLKIWSACTNPNLQMSFWSATMSSSIESFILETLSRQRNTLPVVRLIVGIKDSAVPNIQHKLIYAATEAGKLLALRQLLHPTSETGNSFHQRALRPPFLVFTQTIPRAIALHAELKFDIPAEAGGSSRIATLHSGLSEGARAKVMTQFRLGEIWVIITTDLLARGVDFKGLNGIVNYDVPTSAAAYIHRAGRTGRAGRDGGVAVTLYTRDDIPYIKTIANAIAASDRLRMNAENKSESVQEWLVDALPTPTKREKKALKKQGVISRRSGASESKISTKIRYNGKVQLKNTRGLRNRSREPTSARDKHEEAIFEGFEE